MNSLPVRLPAKRNFRLGMSDLQFDPSAWYQDDPFTTQLLNAYTILIPEGERFIIRSCRAHLECADAALRQELERLFFQEASHARQHRVVVDALRHANKGLAHLQALLNWLAYRLAEPLFPARVRLATAAAIEHHNATIARWFLDRDLLRGVRAGELRRMFVWHFAEEIEHKETVFKLAQSVAPDRWMRITGIVFSLLTFLSFALIAALCLGVMTGVARQPAFWRRAFWHLASRDGLGRSVLVASLRYTKRDFQPRHDETSALLDAALAELSRLGVERPRSNDRPLPVAYRAQQAAFRVRLRAVESQHRFFFSRIDVNAGAWVESGGRRLLNFATYSYLGLIDHPHIRSAAKAAVARYGTGTHGVRLLGGNLHIHESLERALAEFFSREAAITFSSGFMTNLAVISTLVDKDGYVLSDQRNHASIIDGCRMSGAVVSTFEHNDLAGLERQLAAMPEHACKLLVVDAVYSMDGDIAPLPDLIAIRDRYPNTLLMVDEAHSLGVLGDGGRGIEAHFSCHGEIDVLMGTLSKTIPAQGGYIVGSRELIDFLRYNARGFIFSAALSPVASAAALAALEVLAREGEVRRQRLNSNVHYFIDVLTAQGFDLGRTETAIVPVMMADEALAFEMAKRCHEGGIFAMPVAYPAVPVGTERLRLNVTCEHSRPDLDFAVRVLVEAREAVPAGQTPRPDAIATANSIDAGPVAS